MGRDVLGGQAVLEGVLMLNKGKYAVAVRTKDKIAVEKGAIAGSFRSIAQIPFLRGLVALYVTFFVAVRAMRFSTNQALEDDEVGSGLIAVVVLFSLALMLVLLKVIPLAIAGLIVSRQDAVLFNLVDGAVRIVVFVGYVLAISFLPDVKRMFAYHGAEHKVVNAYEATGKLTLKESLLASRLHPRCSTSFVVLILIVAILMFSIVPLTLPTWQVVLIRLLLLIPIAAIGFELIKFAGDNAHRWWAKPLVWPGFWVQKMTTREPDKEMIQVALTAARAVTR